MSLAPDRIEPPQRILMGPGPSDVPASVLQAMAAPTIGHLDPYFLRIMDDLSAILRELFATSNALTLAISGTGSSGMETCFVNLLEPGDDVLVGINGVFGTRMKDVAERCGAQVTAADQDWGRAFDVEQFRSAAGDRRFKLVCVVHAETSTGVHQDLSGFRELADELGAFLLVDTVTSLGGLPVRVDEWGIDAIYSGTQKCLSCPPGLAPVSFSDRAVQCLTSRQTKVQSWYLDLNMISQYWGEDRVYHHTAPINMNYALHEAVRLILEEGLENRFARHARNSKALVAGLETMGLSMQVPLPERLPTLNAVRIPEGLDDATVRKQLLSDYGLEIGGGLGPLKGKIWRIGLMGASSTQRNVALCLTALQSALKSQGFTVNDDPIAAMKSVYEE